MAAYVRTFDCTDDRDANVKILATKFDTELDGIVSNLNNRIDKDGSVTPTANLPMGGFRHTDVGNASARTNYATAAQIEDGALNYLGTVTGTNTLTASLTPAITAYVTGMVFAFKVATTNTASTTLNVNSVGALTIKNAEGNSLSGGELVAGNIVEVRYDGTNAQLISRTPSEIQYNAQTGTSYTLVASDHGKIITLSNASAITLTVPQQSALTLRQGFWCIIRQIGAGQVTVAKQGSDTINSIDTALKLRAQYSEARIDLQTAGSPNTWALFGDIVA